MSDEPKPNGRKYFMVKLGVGLTSLATLGTFVLAAMGKMTGDVTTVVSVYIGSLPLLIGAFQAANAYTTGKAADNGLLGPPKENPPTTTEAG